MTEEIILKWMREKVKSDGFTDAVSLAEDFFKNHDVTGTLDPDFSKTIDAGFKIAQEVYDF